MNLGDPELELVDPTPNVHALFLHFDQVFFFSKLAGKAEVLWSKRMYSSAGVCSYGKNGLYRIALSEPLLKLRPRKNLVETLLHEMIHAYLRVTREGQGEGHHGPTFTDHMNRINMAAGLHISIYHDFHEEVELYTHMWRCNGTCHTMAPHFGVVRRLINRAPGPTDYWWNYHQEKCGGTFVKVKEPGNLEKMKSVSPKPAGDIDNNSKVTKPVLEDSNIISRPDINSTKNQVPNRNIFNTITASTSKHGAEDSHILSPPTKIKKIADDFQSTATSLLDDSHGKYFDINNKRLSVATVDTNLVDCPVCNNKISSEEINRHLDECLIREVIESIKGNDEIDNSKNADVLITIDEQKCPCCGIIFSKSINEHLDECLAFSDTTISMEGASTSFTSDTIVIDDDIFDETLKLNATGTKWPCPSCLKMIEQANMNDHLDLCLSQIYYE